MTPEEMTACLEEIGWSSRSLSKRLGSDESNARKMMKGTREIPQALAEFLREWRAFSETHRKPPLWGLHRAQIEVIRAAEREGYRKQHAADASVEN
jgi:hypothetical protein